MRSRRRFHFAWPALALLACVLAASAWRATLEGGFWCDEVFSIMLIQRPVGRLIAITATDNHPPFYYLLLKAWASLGRRAGLGPGLLWAHLPGLACWAAMVAAAWRAGRRRLGGDGGALLAVAVGCSAMTLWGVTNLRGYATAAPGMAICFLLMHGMLEDARRASLTPRRAAWAWSLYGLVAAVALWSHLLVSFVLFLLGLWWVAATLAMARREGVRRALRSPLAIGGALVQGLVVLGFVPWLFEIHRQVSNLGGDLRRPWMTPTTPMNFFKVFALWLPWGAMGAAGPNPAWWWDRQAGCSWKMAVGVAPVVASAALLLAGWPARRRGHGRPGALVSAPADDGAAERLARAGLAVGLLNVTLLFIFDRLGIQYVFHGPRYTIFSAAIWGAGLAGLVVAAARQGATGRVRWPLAWTLIAPWVAANLAGMTIETLIERDGGLALAIQAKPSLMPAAGAPLYVLPADILPYLRKTLARWQARPAEAFAEIPDGCKDARFLCFNVWGGLRRERDQVIMKLLQERKLGRHVASDAFLQDAYYSDPYEVFRVEGFRASVARHAIDLGLRPMPVAAPPDALEVSAPSDWLERDGWHAADFDGDLHAFRWSQWNRACIRLKHSLGPGPVWLRLQGARTAESHGIESLRVSFRGEPTSVTLQLPPGPFDRTICLTLAKAHRKPYLALEHPIFTEPSIPPSPFPTKKGFQLSMAAVVKPPIPPPEDRHSSAISPRQY